jgi:uncharacterized membrane protein YeiH
MPETAPVAVQIYEEPTNKLDAGTTASAGVGAVIAGALAAYGSEALRDVLVEILPAMAAKEATTNFVIFLVVTVAAYFANKQAGLKAGYNVLDKPNRPLELAPTPAPLVPPPA